MERDRGDQGAIKIAPSVLSADFGNLQSAVAGVCSVADWLHVDIMDGHFVPNLTIGPPVVASLRKHASIYFDCHLMMTNPGEFFASFQKAGADSCTFHIEVGTTSAHIAQLRSLGLGVGLALNPETPFEEVEDFLGTVDLLLCMTVHPGFGGQAFIPSVMEKVRAGRTMADENGLALDIEVDGGIDAITVKSAVDHGANVFVAGSYIFGASNPAQATKDLRAAALGAQLP